MKKALILLALMLCWTGCGKSSPPAADKETSPPAAAQPQPAAPAPQPEAAPPTPAPAPAPTPISEEPPTAPKVAEAPKPPPGMQVCFDCAGAGELVCNALGCKDGWGACPGHCVRLSEGKWEHMHVEGYSDEDVWLILTNEDATRVAVNQVKVGNLMELQNGKWVDTGKCKVCGGTTKVKCSACRGSGRLLCTVCEGYKFVPAQWTVFNHPKQKNPPKTIQLKNGSTIFGKLEGQVGSTIYVRTEDGKQVSLKAANVVSQ